MSLKLNYSVFTQFLLESIIVMQTSLSIFSEECVYCNRKTIISEWGFFEMRNSYTLMFWTKLSPDLRVSSFLSDSLLKAKVFQNFFAGNRFFYFTNSFSAWKKPHLVYKYCRVPNKRRHLASTLCFPKILSNNPVTTS